MHPASTKLTQPHRPVGDGTIRAGAGAIGATTEFFLFDVQGRLTPSSFRRSSVPLRRGIVIDPRFTRSAAVADLYAPIRQGTDNAFLLGLINYCILNDKVQWDYVKTFTNAPYIVKAGFTYQDGLFSGYDEARRQYDRATWEYELGPDGYVVADDTLQNPRSVWRS